MNQLVYIALLISFVFPQSDENPVRISTSGDSISRAGEVFNIKIDVEMDDVAGCQLVRREQDAPVYA